jgi:hypothetical protein
MTRRRRVLFWAILVGLVAAFAWAASVVARSTTGYLYVKQQPPGWRGEVVRSDPRLGFAPVAESAGAEILPQGFLEPIRFDAEGFRIPVEPGPVQESRPVLLALGDSFTFGTACRAEETFPFLVGRGLGLRVLNAGFPGYGLSQMLALAREHVPRHRPQLLLVQASTWLSDRASRYVRRGEFDLVPVPFFSKGSGGEITWQPPLFVGKSFDLPISRYRDSRRGVLDWGSFVMRVGFPLHFHDDPRRLSLLVQRTARRLPKTAPEREIAAVAYGEMLRLCKDSGTRMVVVVLDPPDKTIFAPGDLALPAEVPIVDTTPALNAGLGAPDRESYLRAYGHWEGDPPRLVDEHPNARAHAIIAEQVLRAIEP